MTSLTGISGNSTVTLLCIWRLASADGVGKGNESEKQNKMFFSDKFEVSQNLEINRLNGISITIF